MEHIGQKQVPLTEADEHAVAVAHNMATLLSQLGAMETFIKRRFDEISMEINATSQQIDMSEEGMAKRFGEILGVMNAISFSGDGSTPANTGVELEAVIADTAAAANTILDHCDKMSVLLHPEDPAAWDDPAARAKMLEELREAVQTISVSCSFQDIAGQRIRKTLESINQIEDRISGALEDMGIGAETLKNYASSSSKDAISSGSSQDDIDALFGN